MIHAYLNHIKPVYVSDPGGSTGAAHSSDWISLEHYTGVVFVVVAEVGAAGDDYVVSARQARVVAGTGAKTFHPRAWYRAQAADIQTVAGGAVTELHSNTVTLEGENENLLYCEIDASELDIASGFTCVQIQTSNAGAAAKVQAILAIMVGAKHATNPAALASSVG